MLHERVSSKINSDPPYSTYNGYRCSRIMILVPSTPLKTYHPAFQVGEAILGFLKFAKN
jgi:hypothetical protein